MNDRSSAEFLDPDFYKKALIFCKSYVKKTGGSEDEAKDVLQDAIERFLTKLNDRDFQLRYKAKQLLYGIIKNTWKERLRHKEKYPEEEFSRNEPVDEENDGIEEKLKTEKYIEIFNRCLKLLSAGCIEALTMQKKGYNLEKITMLLGLKSKGRSQDKLYRCRQQLRKIINEDKEYIDLLNEG